MTRPWSFAVVAVALSSLLASAAVGCGGSSCETCLTGGTGTTPTSTTTTTTVETGGTGGGTATSTTFLCKGLMCKRGSQACTVTSHMSQNDMGECTSLPLTCLDETADCSCFTLMAECTCQKQITGEFAIFCDLPN